MTVNLYVDNKDWLKDFTFDYLEDLFEMLLTCVTPLQLFQIDVILTNDEIIQKINKETRGIDKPTNVLSFPLYSKEEIKQIPKREEILLGDVIMSYNVINEEAKIFNKPLYERIAHLFVHGALHIIGYDHKQAEERSIMEAREIEILANLEIESPYILGRKL